MASLGEVAAYWAVESEVFKAVSPLPPGGLPAGTSLLDPDAVLRSQALRRGNRRLALVGVPVAAGAAALGVAGARYRSRSGYGWGVRPKGKRRKAR